MPMGAEPVYQPTTVSVSYEPRPGRNNVRLLPFKILRNSRFQLFLLIFGLLSIATGVAIFSSALASMPSNLFYNKHTEDLPDNDIVVTCSEIPTGIVVLVVFFIVTGVVCIGVYASVVDWRRNCVCRCPLFDKKKSLARQLQCQNGGGCGEGIMALNPSTDPLVSHTQYAPVSELPHRGDEEERRNLMPDNKDCLSSAEESDRMLEPDPRIVLRPMGRLDDA
ncbi:uncharacterized protein LOC105229769 isoform X1 [Bactrocera dorsalis]|uniref:Uncharacterized protein LOC105229769 isoform X1 n=1 Tax=Bactrocera dorsalis TaxID=27457 RepID=A0A6I9VCZ7_BACDO|nr:uncharacterized protein LOC105229769 isoform X1 [Bactrocera dorsalis]